MKLGLNAKLEELEKKVNSYIIKFIAEKSLLKKMYIIVFYGKLK